VSSFLYYMKLFDVGHIPLRLPRAKQLLATINKNFHYKENRHSWRLKTVKKSNSWQFKNRQEYQCHERGYLFLTVSNRQLKLSWWFKTVKIIFQWRFWGLSWRFSTIRELLSLMLFSRQQIFFKKKKKL
jgi:hypothetical protein